MLDEITDPETETATPQGDPAALADPGKKALDAERTRANKAEKALKELQSRLDSIEAANLSKEEQAVKAAADARAAQARAEAEAIRWRIAARHGINDTDAELFLTGSDEETLTRQAERYAEMAQPTAGSVIPGAGKRPPAPPSLADQIAAAEQSGDHRTAMALKAQQLANLARAQR